MLAAAQSPPPPPLPPPPPPPQQRFCPAHRHLALLRTADWRQSAATPLPHVSGEAENKEPRERGILEKSGERRADNQTGAPAHYCILPLHLCVISPPSLPLRFYNTPGSPIPNIPQVTDHFLQALSPRRYKRIIEGTLRGVKRTGNYLALTSTYRMVGISASFQYRTGKRSTMPDSPADVKTQSRLTPPTMPPPPSTQGAPRNSSYTPTTLAALDDGQKGE
ncbi:Protein CBFA2T1 Protein MTG8 [Larimichthys crocea]|uniref:Protein CBFA2T1 Protein MTG8 n=1 Tax=Larimichthys crocea TaxID=215358 RepID=A0A6G0HS73_LARCR|nr:Protein CBFA2T1 Protein MTG8 [Larimichthys crocea]